MIHRLLEEDIKRIVEGRLTHPASKDEVIKIGNELPQHGELVTYAKAEFLIRNPICKQIIFHNIVFESEIAIHRTDDITTGITVQFNNCEFKKGCIIAAIPINQLEFIECSGRNILVDGLDVKHGIEFRGNSIANVFLNVVTGAVIAIRQNKNCKVSISNSYFEHFTTEESLDGFNLWFYSLHNGASLYSKKKIENVGIGDLIIKANPTFSGSMLFEDIAVDVLTFNGTLEKGKIDFNNIALSHAIIERLYNIGGSITFSSIRLNRFSIRIRESDLGKTRLFNIDFTNNGSVYANTVNLNDLIYSNVKWCKRISPKGAYPMTFAQLRDAYKQLKTISAKQNDKPDELRFYTLEMRSYSEELKDLPKRQGDKLILWFNRVTNDHGQSWPRALLLVFCTVTLGYLLSKILLGQWHFDPSSKTIAANLSEYLECLNPTRKFSDSFGLKGRTKDDIGTSLAKITDIVFLRVLLGLFYFQMIKAFRKYVK